MTINVNDVVIVGSGINSLVCAAILGKAGKSVLIVERAGLIEKANNKSSSKKDVTYRVTDRGLDVTETYAGYRQELLLSMTSTLATDADIENVVVLLNHLSGLYDQAARVAATHRL